MSDNEKEAMHRCKYASQLLTELNIPHVIKKQEIGHINILNKEGKVVMSFWARTGKFIFNVMPREDYRRNTERGDRGLKRCIELYNEEFKIC